MTIELIGPALMVCSHIFMSLGIAMHWTGSGDLVDASSAIKQNHQTLLLPTVTLILIQTLSIRQKQANVKHCQPPPESHMMFSSSRQITGSQIFLLKWEEVGGLMCNGTQHHYPVVRWVKNKWPRHRLAIHPWLCNLTECLMLCLLYESYNF